MDMMKQEIKAEWVTALRSGDYQQALRMLFRVEDGEVTGHCCLGVLTDLYLKDKDLTLTELRNSDGDSEYLTKAVREWSGLSEADPEVEARSDYSEVARENLSTLNDGSTHLGQLNFLQIATLIEGSL